MSLRFRSQLNVDLLPDEQLDNRWEVIMPGISLTEAISGSGYSSLGFLTNVNLSKYYPIVEEIIFAPLGFKNSQNIRAVTNYYNVPVDKEDAKEANITMFCDSGMLAQYYLMAWRGQMFNAAHEFYYYPWQYKKDIVVLFYGAGSAAPVAKFTLKGCYPLFQDDYKLKYSREPNRLTLTQKFNVDRVVADSTYASTAIMSALLSGNPLGTIADQALARLSSSTFAGTVEGYEADRTLGGTGGNGLLGALGI